MVANTFSLAATGVISDRTQCTTKQAKIPDLQVPIAGTTLTTGSLGGIARATSTGEQILCQNPDGSSSWYTIDAERSLPGTPVMRPV